jgi:L-ribulokinase
LEASDAMGSVTPALYKPNEERAKAYDLLYSEYETLHDYFGRGTNDVMKRLKKLRREASRVS